MSDGTAVFLQVRLSSSRLPEKALLPLAGVPVIVHAMRALESLPAARRALVTDAASAPRLQPLADSCGYAVFAGDPDDVLARFCDAAAHFDASTIVRATGDNPLVSAATAREALQLQEATEADYAGITGTPYGTGVEIIRRAALDDLNALTSDPYEREHVSPGLYRRPDRYRVVTRPAADPVQLPEMRVTLDTPEDYNYIAGIFREIYRGKPVEVPELVAYGQRQHRNSA
tara:strand:- start:187 stop:876 length:690 start_codon:yes stop_codon:yes gene_type:complete